MLITAKRVGENRTNYEKVTKINQNLVERQVEQRASHLRTSQLPAFDNPLNGQNRFNSLIL